MGKYEIVKRNVLNGCYEWQPSRFVGLGLGPPVNAMNEVFLLLFVHKKKNLILSYLQPEDRLVQNILLDFGGTAGDG